MFSQSRYNPNKLHIYKQWLITGILLFLMTISRTAWFPYLQDTSWAVFFLIGFYLRSFLGLPLIIISAMVIDFVQIAARGGHQDYFLSPSYFYIIPAYAALWFAGRFFAAKYSENVTGFLIFICSAILGIVICQLISSGGYYWISKNFIELSFNELVIRTLEYLPLALKINLFYLIIAAVIHLTFTKFLLFNNQAEKNS